MDSEEEKTHLQNWLGEGGLPVMRGLQLADKLHAGLKGPNMEAIKTCVTEEILNQLLEIVNTLNDGIKKLSPLLPPEIATLKHPTHSPRYKFGYSTSTVKDLEQSPRKSRKSRKRCISKSIFKVQGVHEGFDDGHTWRKYGQKMILSKRHPRSYYRCIHKGDLNCPALKQVQQCDGNTSCFDITYIEKHTCKWRQAQNHVVSPLLSPLHSSSYTSSPLTQELNSDYVEPSLKTRKVESEAEVQYTMSRLYSLMEQETTSLQVTAANYTFPQAMGQHEESHNSLTELNEQFPAFIDFESELFL